MGQTVSSTGLRVRAAHPADVPRLAELINGYAERGLMLPRVPEQLARVEAAIVLGQAAAAESDMDAARDHFQQAVLLLTAIGADRSAAQVWYELAGLLEDVGDYDGARTAYRSAAAATGLAARRPHAAPTRPRAN